MEKELASVLKYFAFFGYSPNFDDVYTFFPRRINKKQLKYTPAQYGIGRKILNIKYKISKRKLQNWRYRSYIKLLSLFPQIKLVGLSGSISMMNADKDDDIDLFIITAKNRLFTGRLISLLLAQLIGIRRDRLTYPRRPSQIGNKNKVCLNLFFNESNLKVPKFKQTEFVGHEVLQMKPIIVKGNIYERFLKANRWVLSFFPNAVGLISKIKYQRSKTSLKLKVLSFELGFDICTLIFEIPASLFEKVTKSLQLIFINRHKTTEIITDFQLWFHPDDFEKKIKRQSRTTS